jgi:hypothetical protein
LFFGQPGRRGQYLALLWRLSLTKLK